MVISCLYPNLLLNHYTRIVNGKIFGKIWFRFLFYQRKEKSFLNFYMKCYQPNKRLKEMKKVQSSSCTYCGQEESNMHLVYFCPVTNGIIIWLGNLLRKYCSIDNINYIKILFLDLPKLGEKRKEHMLTISN